MKDDCSMENDRRATPRPYRTCAECGRMTFVRPPGGNRSWLEVLPEDYRDNPEVLVVMAPNGSRGDLERTNDGAMVGVLTTPRGTKRALQCVDPPLVGYQEHKQLAERHGYEMAPPEYFGAAEDIPKKFLLTSFRFPLVFQKNRLWEAPLNLKNHLRSLTDKEHDGN